MQLPEALHAALTATRQCKLRQNATARADAALANTQLKSRAGKDVRISYPCVILNVMVAAHNTNDQYADLMDAAKHTYATSSQMSIEFEVDGPYRVSPMAAAIPQLPVCADTAESLPCSGRHRTFLLLRPLQ